MVNNSGSKQIIYWDVDDVILNTSEVAINIINRRYLNEGQHKTFEDRKDWELKSIWRGINKQIAKEIFESDDFWDEVKVREEFKEVFDSIGDKYEHKLVTKGTECNHDRKQQFLINDTYMKDKQWDYICVGDDEDKNIVDMSNGIFVDDKLENLVVTNARIKILLKNGIDTDYNTPRGKNTVVDNLYIANDLEEVKQLLEFNCYIEEI